METWLKELDEVAWANGTDKSVKISECGRWDIIFEEGCTPQEAYKEWCFEWEEAPQNVCEEWHYAL